MSISIPRIIVCELCEQEGISVEQITDRITLP